MGMFDGLFGGGNDSYKDAQRELARIEPMLHEQYDPYRNLGMRTMPGLEDKYSQLMNNPAAMQAMLGSGYQQSPGYDFQMQQAMNAANNAAAAGGTLGTNQHQQDAMKYATGLANQDYWNYYNQNANLFGQGLEGTHNLFNTGYDATNQLAGGLGNLYGSQANLQMAQGQTQDNMLSSLLGAGVGAAGYALGGPLGGMAAKGLSSMFNKPNSTASTGWQDNSFNPSYGTRPIGSF